MDHPTDIHPLFAAVFATWYRQADALSALPQAPVVPDDPRVGPLGRGRHLVARFVGRLRVLARARPGRGGRTAEPAAPRCAPTRSV